MMMIDYYNEYDEMFRISLKQKCVLFHPLLDMWFY